MKKIVILCLGILTELFICFADGYIQRQSAQELMSSDVEEQGEAEETIRVLIGTAGYESVYHDAVTVASAEGFTVGSPGTDAAEEIPGGQEETFTVQSGAFDDSGVLTLTAADGKLEIRGLGRERKSEVYEGKLELRRSDPGLLLINELPLETYLCGVVPSEMPSSYPAEALKAQAVCARTYAKKRMQEDGMLCADLDDSVSYQVYNNQDRAGATDAAVRETAGLVLTDGDGLIDALYYSTSCGLDLDISLSDEEVFAAFLAEDSVTAYEAEEPWYRWQADIRLEDLGDAAGLSVQSRLDSGAVNVLQVTGTDGAQSYVEGEYSVREYLAGACEAVILQDGERVEHPALLPSAFFILQPPAQDGSPGVYHLLGGGYGHGIGMSQNGAKHMALEGYDFTQILQHYYPDAQVSASPRL